MRHADARLGTQMHAYFAQSRLGGTVLGFVKPSSAHIEKAAGLWDRNALHLQLVDEPVAHLSSRAKKADTFFIRPLHFIMQLY